MSRYRVVASLKVRTPEGIRVLQAGEVIALPEDMALRLIEGGKIKPLPLPYFDLDGSLVIPFGSDSCFHWWKGGQSVKEIIEEVRAWKH